MIGPRLINPPELIAWNTDKRYLDDLAAAGIPVVPTSFVAPGGPVVLGSEDCVVKPTVSAGSKDTARFAAGEHERALELVERIHASGRTAMVQPYIPSVDERGETALLYFGGRFSHAIHKGPLLRPGEAPAEGLFALEEIHPRTPTPAERALALKLVQFDEAVQVVAQGPTLGSRGQAVPSQREGDTLTITLDQTSSNRWLFVLPGG